MTDSGLNLIHVDTADDWRGGQAQVDTLIRGLARLGHRISLVSPEGSRLAERLVGQPVEIVSDTPRGDWDFAAGRRLRRLAREREADLIHVHSARAHAMAWWASGGGDSPPVVVSRRVDFSVGGNWFSRRKYVHPACYYLAISTAVRDVLIDGGVDAGRIQLVPSGVDPEKFTYRSDRAETRASLGIADDQILICNVAALTDHKDQANLIRAAHVAATDAPMLRFVILGEGELRSELEDMISRLGLVDRVRLLGFRDKIEPYIAAADIFVMSSHLEGLGTSILDAMLLGVPVVATRAGGIPDVVVDGETGLLVEKRNSEALAKAIVKMAGDADLRARCGEAGARRVREEFTVARTIERTDAAYREILAAAGRDRIKNEK